MIIRNPPRLNSPSNVYQFLVSELFGWMKDLCTGLIRLDFLENFQSFRVSDLVIPAGGTALITNPLPFVPSTRLIVRQIGNGVVTDGTWTIQTLQMINNGAVPVTVSIIFFR